MSNSITLRSGTTGFAGVKRLREILKLSVRGMLHRRATYGWLQLLNGHPLFRELVLAKPRLLYKIYRPYLSNTLSCAQRLALIDQHYRFILRHGLAPLAVRAARGAVTLAAIDGKGGVPYQLQLRAIEPMEREGELVLQLVQGEQLVYSCAFTFFHSEHGEHHEHSPVLGIGCMQGPKGEQGLQLIKDATRELHGLRPKSMMVKLLGQLGHAYGCTELRLVGNVNRAVCRATGQGKVHADYDALWQECEATPRADGDYRLACEALAAPDMAAVASKKRSEVRKRHETLAALSAAMLLSMNGPRLEMVPSTLLPSFVPTAQYDSETYALA